MGEERGGNGKAMKKKLKVMFGVASGLSFVGAVVVGWVAFLGDGMGFPTLNTLATIFFGGFIICLLVFAILMLSDCDPNEGGSIPPGGPGFPW